MALTGYGYQVALSEVVAEAREQEREEELRAQADLFEIMQPPRSGVFVASERGPGRPLGSRNKRTDEAARTYVAMHGDPLAGAIKIAAMPVLGGNGEVLRALSSTLGMSRAEAARWWLGVLHATLPYCHQRLATLTVKPEGSPEGEPITWSFTGDDGGVVELVPPPETVDVPG